MPRRINMLSAPWNYHWPGRAKVTCFSETGIMLIPEHLNAAADAAIAAGVAVEFDPVTKPATRRSRSARPKTDAANPRQSPRMDRTHLAAADSADGGATVADAG